MIIGAKRKEEVIKMKKYGVYDQYMPMEKPITFYTIEKNFSGKWEVWEMVSEKDGQPIAGYKIKTQAIQSMLEIMYRKGPQVFRVNKVPKR